MTEEIELKTCRACGEPKPITAFYKLVKTGTKQFYRPDCIECMKPVRAAERRAKMADPVEREKERAKARARYAARPNPDPAVATARRKRYRAAEKAKREADPVRMAAYKARQKANYQKYMADPVKREAARQSNRRRMQDPVNRAKHNAAARAWNHNNRARVRENQRKRAAALKAAKAAAAT